MSYSFSGVSASDAGEGFGPLSRRCPWWTLVQSRSGQSSSNKVVLHPDRPRIFLLSVSSSCWRGGRRRGRKERRIFCLIRLFRRLWMAGLDWLCGWPLEASSFSRGTARMRLRLLGGAPLRPCRWSFSDAFDSGVCAAWLLRQSTQLGASFFFRGDDSHVFLPLPNLLDLFPGLMDVDGWMLPMDLLLFHLSDPGGLIRVHGLQFFTDICSSLISGAG